MIVCFVGKQSWVLIPISCLYQHLRNLMLFFTTNKINFWPRIHQHFLHACIVSFKRLDVFFNVSPQTFTCHLLWKWSLELTRIVFPSEGTWLQTATFSVYVNDIMSRKEVNFVRLWRHDSQSSTAITERQLAIDFLQELTPWRGACKLARGTFKILPNFFDVI